MANCPCLKKDVDYVERVQRLATSKVKGMKDLSYVSDSANSDYRP